jgi:hypothetical protein
VYTDDGILIDPSRDNKKDRISDFKAIFNIEVQGNLQDYLGIRIERKSDNSIHMTQPHLIASPPCRGTTILAIKDANNYCTINCRSELIALSEATRFVRSITFIIDELKTRGLLTNSKPKIHCKVFEDNAAALEISKSPKI